MAFGPKLVRHLQIVFSAFNWHIGIRLDSSPLAEHGK